MRQDNESVLGPGPKRVRSLTDILLRRLAEELQKSARKRGGALTDQQIEKVIDSFRSHVDSDSAEFYRAAWNECLAVFEEVRKDNGRRMPFERLMVQRFAHLLPPSSRSVEAGRELSRRIVPGYLSALQQMLGPVLLEQYQSRSRELVRIIQTARGTEFDWNDVEGDPTSHVIVNDVLVHVSKHFSDIDRRRRWMIEVVNANMPLGEDEVEREWRFGEAEFHLLMEALFTPLRLQMNSSEGARRLSERYGTVACELLGELFRDLNLTGQVTVLRKSVS